MDPGMLHQQEPSQASPSGSAPRFRPYPSPNHQITKGRYITSNDSRGYIPVYEYPLNGQWIMMDIDDGYILWTGIWKALGNSKADIVKMIDSQPDLAPLIRRVRGGYLKIQGTWMPYEVALKLSKRVAWLIRDDLVPLFGPDFPRECLSPDQPGYGQVVPSSNGRRRARRATQPSTLQKIARAPAGWTVVTPSTSTGPAHVTLAHQEQHGVYSQHQNQRPYTPTHDYTRTHHQSDFASTSTVASPYMNHPHSSPMDGHDYHPQPHRYSGPVPPHGSSLHPPTSFRKFSAPTTSSSTNSRMGLSIDVHSLSRGVEYRGPSSSSTTTPLHTDDEREGPIIRLAPIRAHEGAQRGEYVLPPISAMHNLSGGHDSPADVLRRLKMDDDESYRSSWSGRSGRSNAPDDIRKEDTSRRHSLSTHLPSVIKAGDTSPRFQPYASSYQDHGSYRRPRSSSSVGQNIRRHPPSAYTKDDHSSHWADSHDLESNSATSPISPATPNSSSECSLTLLAHAAYNDHEKTLPTGRLNAAQWTTSSSPPPYDGHGSRRNSYEV